MQHQAQTEVNDNRYPLGKKIELSEHTWFEKYKYLSKNEPYHVLLESGRGGKYSIIGLKPFAILKAKNRVFSVTTKQGTTSKNGDPLELMRQWMSTYRTARIEGYPDFHGGAIGYASYDLVREFENIPSTSNDDLDTDDLYFLVFDDIFVYDHDHKQLWLITHYEGEDKPNAEERLAKFEKAWTEPVPDWTSNTLDQAGVPDYWETSFSEDEFAKAVEKVRDYISAGDVFQVNLSVRQMKPLRTEPFHIYEKLRQLNPSPYMGYFHTPDFQLVNGSPELLVKKRGDEVSTRPIAGTRSRGKDDAEDEQLAKSLIENEKERAEHVMLVDLERNDLGRVSKYGSVEVNELMVIEKYSHVMHIVSNVRGILAEGVNPYDIVRATFPGGTITGAPKVRTMEIIEELEPVRRGVYTGSIGWIGFNDDLELNITIRTLVAKKNRAYVQAGAGIVIDSNPSAEYKEALKKAEALWLAKELSEEEVLKQTKSFS